MTQSMSKTSTPSNTGQTRSIESRVEDLSGIEDELRLVAAANVPYSKHASRFLAALQEARNE